MNWLSTFLSSDDRAVDSLVIGGLLGGAFVMAMTVFVAIQDYHTWSPIAFATAFASILGATHSIKTWRDGGACPPKDAPDADAK